MKANKTLRLMVILAIVFFHARFFSDVFLKLADSSRGSGRKKCLKASHILFLPDYFPVFRYAYALLEEGYRDQDQEKIQESMGWFKKSIRLNPFYHLSHHHLGKAYFLYNYPRSEYFNEGIREFKKAVDIDRNNKSMVKDTVEVLLSMWPLLPESDRELCLTLAQGLMPRLAPEEFMPLVELWWLYSRDTDFMDKLVEKRPDLLKDVSSRLVELKGPLGLRWKYLAGYESHLLKDVIRQHRSGNYQGTQLEFERALLNQLRQYRAYHRLAETEGFDLEKYRKYRQILTMNRIKLLLGKTRKTADKPVFQEIEQLVQEYIQAGPEIKDLYELESFLIDIEFFRPNDFRSLHLKYLLQFNQSNFRDIIDEVDNLKKSITLVKKESLPDLVKTLLMLADAYEASKLLTVADATLREIMEISPDNPGAWLRLVRIQRTLGDDDPETRLFLQGKTEKLKNSRLVTVEHLEQDFSVYLMEEKQIEVAIADSLREKLGEKKIIQIFVDRMIAYEAYIEKLPEVIVVEVKETEEFQEVTVEVKFQ